MTAPSTLPAPYTTELDRLERAALDGVGLPEGVKRLAIALAFANKGRDGLARRHGEAALAAGLTRPEVVEALLAAVLSRGTWVLEEMRWLVDAAPEGEWQVAGERAAAASEIREYFDATFGSVPGWLHMLIDTAPQALESYYALRAEILRDGALPRRHKELLLVVVNAAERYDTGLTTHLRGALDGGAKPEELYEAVRAAIVPGGMVAWIAGADAAGRVLKERRDV
ncbi:MAG TPA: carboxymuconolactone decarboxylase family protein [Conexibacter sp.]